MSTSERPWFVVGGAGFIGTNLAKRRECEVFDLHRGEDAKDLRSLTNAMDGHQTIVHLAANADISKGADDPDLDFASVDITRNVCKAAREVGASRIIYLSGSGVYGIRSVGATEETPCFPISPYGASKLASEAILNAYAAMYGISVLILRPANVVGPHQTHGVGFDFMRKLKEDPADLQILGNGGQYKSYVHVDDVIDFMEMGYEGTYNIGSDDQLYVRHIALMAANILGIPAPRMHFDKSWPGDIPDVLLDCTKAKETHWRARSSGQAMKHALVAMA